MADLWIVSFFNLPHQYLIFNCLQNVRSSEIRGDNLPSSRDTYVSLDIGGGGGALEQTPNSSSPNKVPKEIIDVLKF